MYVMTVTSCLISWPWLSWLLCYRRTWKSGGATARSFQRGRRGATDQR